MTPAEELQTILDTQHLFRVQTPCPRCGYDMCRRWSKAHHREGLAKAHEQQREEEWISVSYDNQFVSPCVIYLGLTHSQEVSFYKPDLKIRDVSWSVVVKNALFVFFTTTEKNS